MSTKPSHEIVARAPCGCVKGITMPPPWQPLEAANEAISEWQAHGLRIELLPRQEAVDAFCAGLACDHGKEVQS